MLLSQFIIISYYNPRRQRKERKRIPINDVLYNILKKKRYKSTGSSVVEKSNVKRYDGPCRRTSGGLQKS